MRKDFIEINGIVGKFVLAGKYGIVLSQRHVSNGYWFIPFCNKTKISAGLLECPYGGSKKECIAMSNHGVNLHKD